MNGLMEASTERARALVLNQSAVGSVHNEPLTQSTDIMIHVSGLPLVKGCKEYRCCWRKQSNPQIKKFPGKSTSMTNWRCCELPGTVKVFQVLVLAWSSAGSDVMLSTGALLTDNARLREYFRALPSEARGGWTSAMLIIWA